MKPIYWRSLAMTMLCFSHSAFTPAFADQRGKAITVEIHKGDLDLTSQAGARTALDCIRAATRKVCGAHSSFGLSADRMLHDCREDFTRRAVRAFEAPMVTELYERRMGPPKRTTRQAGDDWRRG
jgi:UrcA family protein